MFKQYWLEAFIVPRSAIKERRGRTRKIRISEIPLIWKDYELK